jgi:GDPmannose 4,6-dehydratase
MPRALIIGHRGQDGQILWDQLGALGYSLVGISRGGVQTQGFEWATPCSIEDEAEIRGLIKALLPTHLYYLAAHHHSSQDAGLRDADLWDRSWVTHVLGFGRVLDALALLSPSTRVFYASSSRIFGTTNAGRVEETTPRLPDDCYGVTKVAGMQLADYYRRVHGLFVSCGVLFNHESPLRAKQFVTQRVVRGLVAISRGESDRLELGSLDAQVDWGYAPDYTRAMQAMLAADVPGDFVVATGILHSVGDLVAVAAAHLGLAWRDVVAETGGILQRNAQGLCGDNSRLRAATGWMPTVDFAEMVRRLVDAELARAG